jgi:IMP dehydrogenase
MTSDGLITAPVGTSLEEAKAILHRHRIEKLPLVDRDGRLKGLITVKDILKKIDYPAGATDERGRLLCAAALGVGEKALERLDCLVEAGVDVVAIDTAHGHTRAVLDTMRAARRRHPRLSIMAGNVVDGAGARALVEAGAGAIKVGIGAGSICTTRIVAGAGVPQISAIAACAAAGRELDVPVIADGGIKYSGDIVKALAAGADAVMLGSLLAGLEESPGEIILYEGRRYKVYRGMGSMGAMQGYGADRYGSGIAWPGVTQARPAASARQARAGGGRGAGSLPRSIARRDLPDDGRRAFGHGLCRRGRPGRVARQGPLRAHHQRRPARKPPPRRPGHQGSAELSGAKIIRN